MLQLLVLDGLCWGAGGPALPISRATAGNTSPCFFSLVVVVNPHLLGVFPCVLLSSRLLLPQGNSCGDVLHRVAHPTLYGAEQRLLPAVASVSLPLWVLGTGGGPSHLADSPSDEEPDAWGLVRVQVVQGAGWGGRILLPSHSFSLCTRCLAAQAQGGPLCPPCQGGGRAQGGASCLTRRPEVVLLNGDLR